MSEFETPTEYISSLLGRVLKGDNSQAQNPSDDAASESSYRHMVDSDLEDDSGDTSDLTNGEVSGSHLSTTSRASVISRASGRYDTSDGGSDNESISEDEESEDVSTDGKDLPQASKRHKKEFIRTFEDTGIQAERENLLKVYSCALSKEILYQGKMYVTQNYICFNSRIFNVSHKLCLPFKDVTVIEPRMIISIIPNGIEVNTSDHQKYVFASFGNRNGALKLLRKLRTRKEMYIEEGSPILRPLSRSSSFKTMFKRTNSGNLLDNSIEPSKSNPGPAAAGLANGNEAGVAISSTSDSVIGSNVDPGLASDLRRGDSNPVSSNPPNPDANPVAGALPTAGNALSTNTESKAPAVLTATPVEKELQRTNSLVNSSANPVTTSTSNSDARPSKSRNRQNSSSQASRNSGIRSFPSSTAALHQTCEEAFDFFKPNNFSFMASSSKSTSKSKESPSIAPMTSPTISPTPNTKSSTQAPAPASSAPASAPAPSSKWPVANLGPESHAKTSLPAPNDNEKVLNTEVIKAPPGVVANLVFGSDTAWLRRFLVDVDKNRELADLGPFPSLSAGSERKYEYIKPLSGPVGPKQTSCKCTERIEKWDFGSYIEVITTTVTPDVPAGNSFTTQTRAIFAWGDNNTTVLRLGTWLEWTGKTWLKVAIEKGAVDGQTSYCKSMVSELAKSVSVKQPGSSTASTSQKQQSSSEPKPVAKSSSKSAAAATAKAAEAIAAWERACIVLSVVVFILLVLLIHYWRKSRRTSFAIPQGREDLFRLQQELSLWQWIDDRQQRVTAPSRSFPDVNIAEAVALSEKKLASLKKSFGV